ncbi:MAG TPA: imidazoleglycerol-phosphate dehydratase HisB [Methylomirabilota bacterium]|nr:imidazoleglycerol-phosphate dehydratase HisB [Methylomirabilota bacterium]
MARRRRRHGRGPRPTGAAPDAAPAAIGIVGAAEPVATGNGGAPAVGRVARIERRTRETEILLQLNVDGRGETAIDTTIPFFNHMLEAAGKHGLLDLRVSARGDTEVDLHHTVEDVGICLGKAFHEALGDRRGIVRFGTAHVPMDEALAAVHVDVSGRPYFSYNVPFAKTRVGNFDLDLLKDFFRAFAMNAMLNLHVNLHYGENLHHIAEALFKAFGRALAEASRMNPRIEGVLSTKGTL